MYREMVRGMRIKLEKIEGINRGELVICFAFTHGMALEAYMAFHDDYAK
jgi:hypothetical protein